MGEDPVTEEEPKDRDKTPVGDDFLLKYLPGSSPAVVQTRQQIMRLNMPKSRSTQYVVSSD